MVVIFSSSSCLPDPSYCLSKSFTSAVTYPVSSPLLIRTPTLQLSPNLISHSTHRPLCFCSSSSPGESSERLKFTKDHFHSIRRIAASAVLFAGLGLHSLAAVASTQRSTVPVVGLSSVEEERIVQDDREMMKSEDVDSFENEEQKAAFEMWKSKVYALTVPLRIVSLRESVPPSWIKDFVQSQGKRLKFSLEYRGCLQDIFSEVSSSFDKKDIKPKSAAAADMITLGDSWLGYAISRGLVEPLHGIEEEGWFRGLSDKWKVYLCRNSEGNLSAEGKIWAVPYRWGSMVIMYKKNKFQEYNLAPIEDWEDLWRPELAGKISMVNCPREVIGAVLKSIDASYNTNNIDSHVPGGINAVQDKLALLAKQVRLFDSADYLKAFTVGDVWVAVGWSSDVIAAANRLKNVSVIVPKSGASLWADLWAIPAASKVAAETESLGGRVRGASPLIYQWMEFCLQPARRLPFERQVIPGGSPSSIENSSLQLKEEEEAGKLRLDTNLIAGVPPPHILARCEFLEPLSDSTMSDYQTLLARMHQQPCQSGLGFQQIVQNMFPKIGIFKAK
ncbi:spermidine-binding periplasmic protein SpuE-like [Impatiens glandulifera]|uniref:spermidine-binding periplasmic protein SpuE-like n=1 Tax=Impatiens glandulifera TaxID=253017 RepID=UPI001FB0F5A7|nr:spermidine-binding periplasmic protein SpuE-like [Impatiens glandulifera]